MSTTYQTLLQEFVPRPIASERAYQRTLKQIDGLIRKAKRSRAEDDLLELLATLVEQYEIRQGYTVPDSFPARSARRVNRSTAIDASGIIARFPSTAHHDQRNPRRPPRHQQSERRAVGQVSSVCRRKSSSRNKASGNTATCDIRL